MTDDFDFPNFKPVGQKWREEYSRIRKLGRGDYWEGQRLEDKAAQSKDKSARSKMSPFALGVADHRLLRDASETHNARPPFVRRFAEGTPDRLEYERGWNAAISPVRGYTR